MTIGYVSDTGYSESRGSTCETLPRPETSVKLGD